MTIIYAASHLFGMSSACANPFLYGWFNGNFRSEFTKILGTPLRLCIEMVEGSANKDVCSLGQPTMQGKADCINKVDYRTSEAPISPIIRQIRTDYDTGEVMITNPTFSSQLRLDVEMVDAEEPSTSTNNIPLALIRKEESMETFL